MRAFRLLAAAAVVAAVPLLGAAPAGAGLVGPCEARGTLQSTHRTYDAAGTNSVVIPRADTVDWEGKVAGGGGKRPISGSVHVKLPAPFGNVEIGSWGEESDTYANSGTYKYSFPSVLGGIDVPVTGSHSEPGARCKGAVVVRLEGGGLKNPAVAGSLVLTVIPGAALLMTFLPKGV